MSFLQDEGAKRFYLYLTAVLAAATIFVVAIWGSAGRLLEDVKQAAAKLKEGQGGGILPARAGGERNRDGQSLCAENRRWGWQGAS